MKKHSIFFILLLVVSLAGCINYDEEVKVNADGSGKLTMHYSLSQQLTAMMAMGDSSGDDETDDMPFRFKEDEINRDLQATGVRVDSVTSKVENEEQHFYVDVSFDNITDLNNTKTFREMPFEWLVEGNTITVRRVLKGKPQESSGGDDSASQMGDQMAQAMFGNAAFKFKLVLPGKALPSPDTNGKILEDGKTVTWEFPLTQLGKGDKIMEAKFQAGGGAIGLMSWIFIGGAALISLICIVIVIIVARKM